MIDEEDDEEILKKRVNLKTILKTIFVIVLIVFGAVIIYFPIFSGDQVINFIIGFMLICFGSMIIQYQTEPAEPKRQTLTILTCTMCGLTKVRNYNQGDFVYKRLENCEKCNDTMKISKIYSVKLKKQTRKDKKQEILTKKSSKK